MNAGQPEEATITSTSTNNTITAGHGETKISINAGEEETFGEAKLPEQCARVHNMVYDFLARDYTGSDATQKRLRAVQDQTRTSLRVISEALERYSLNELSFSYNGGKDCLVLLLLYLAALHTAATLPTHPLTLPPYLPTIYILTPDPFPAVTTFVHRSAADYALSLTSHPSPMRSAFASHLAAHPHIRAIFVGTRRTDPHGGELTFFDETDRGWPGFVRVHPVIDWHYAEIWAFVRELGVEYCGLYDEGYTSLGGVEDTAKNPALRVMGESGEVVGWRPAYELMEDGEERLGRER